MSTSFTTLQLRFLVLPHRPTVALPIPSCPCAIQWRWVRGPGEPDLNGRQINTSPQTKMRRATGCQGRPTAARPCSVPACQTFCRWQARLRILYSVQSTLLAYGVCTYMASMGRRKARTVRLQRLSWGTGMVAATAQPGTRGRLQAEKNLRVLVC